MCANSSRLVAGTSVQHVWISVIGVRDAGIDQGSQRKLGEPHGKQERADVDFFNILAGFYMSKLEKLLSALEVRLYHEVDDPMSD